MEMSVQNFRGITAAHLGDEKMSLIVGNNGAGKTSILLGLGCALSGSLMPLGLKKTDGGALVKTGATIATAEIKTTKGTVRAEWPKGERSTTLTPPYVSEEAAGLSSPVDMKEKDCQTYFGTLLKASPSRSDFNAGLVTVGLITPSKDDNGDFVSDKNGEPVYDEQRLAAYDKIWDTVERDGWPAAHDRAQGTGREQKGVWQHVTKEAWGKKKGEVWQPAAWTSDLSQQSQASLEDKISAARADLEVYIGKLAVSQEELDRLENLSEQIGPRKTALDAATDKVSEIKDAISKAKQKINAIGNTKNDAGVPCPHCGERIEIQQKNSAEIHLQKAVVIEESKLKERRLEHAGAEGELAHHETDLTSATTQFHKASTEYGEATDAKRKLDAGVSAENASEELVNKSRNTLQRAEEELAAFNKKTEADRTHRSILKNILIVELLSPAGVRHTVLKRKLDRFNKGLKTICAAANWGLVSLNETLGAEYDSRRYLLLSASEQFRVRVALQIACANEDNSEVIIIDGAEILDSSGRSGLLQLLSMQTQRVILGMTLKAPNLAPNLKGMGVGAVYWIEEGRCQAA